jgi:anti-sigma factor RsiW
MITCRELAELLIDFVSGELSPEHQERVEQHLSDCRLCMVYVETYKTTIRLTRHLPCAPLPPELERRLREALTDLHRENP